MDKGEQFLLAVWGWMRAHPTCSFDDFAEAVNRIFDLMQMDQVLLQQEEDA